MKLISAVLPFVLLLPNFGNESAYKQQDSVQQRYSQGVINKEKHEEFKCLVSLLWYEARGETDKGIIYVLSVVENRKNSEKYPSSYCKIVLQNKQFSFVHEMQAKGLSVKVKPSSEKEEKRLDFIKGLAYNAVKGKFSSQLPSNVLHYTTKKVRNYWTKKKPVYAVEGNHKFYISLN